jgi:hypothetical protein
MPTNRHVDAWGAYRPAIEDHLAACADYLGRLERSLAGEIAPDRHYFSDKAHQLHQSARRLERLVQDTDRWLAGCHAMVEHRYEDGTRSLGECELPAGHDGDHDGDPARLVGETLCVRARDLPTTRSGSATGSAGSPPTWTASSAACQPSRRRTARSCGTRARCSNGWPTRPLGWATTSASSSGTTNPT